MSEENLKLKVYEVDCGATYYVAATSFKSAFDTWSHQFFGVERASDEFVDYIYFDLVSDKRAKEIMIVIDGGGELGEDKKSTYELAREAKAPSVIGCSEW